MQWGYDFRYITRGTSRQRDGSLGEAILGSRGRWLLSEPIESIVLSISAIALYFLAARIACCDDASMLHLSASAQLQRDVNGRHTVVAWSRTSNTTSLLAEVTIGRAVMLARLPQR